METKTCNAAWQHMTRISKQGQARNFVQILDMTDYVVETPLFPQAVLQTYSRINMEKDITTEQEQHVNDQRGGAQGNYREGMSRKIANVVDCLTRFPKSKRALITVCNEPMPDHSHDADAKCLRELHLYLDENDKLSGTVFFRAQAASIFPKNIHLIGSIMTEVAARLPEQPELGTLYYLATILVSDRN